MRMRRFWGRIYTNYYIIKLLSYRSVCVYATELILNGWTDNNLLNV